MDLVAATYTNDVWAAANNTTVTTSSAPAAGSTTNSLRFNAAGAFIVTLSGTNVINTGGVLVGSTVGTNDSTITGGSLTSGNTNADGTHDMILINNNTTASGGSLVVNSNIVDNGGSPVGLTAAVTTTGTVTGAIRLGGINTFTGPSYIDGATVILTSPGAWNGQSALNFAPQGTLAKAGTFDLNGNSITVNGLSTTQTINPILQNAFGAAVTNATLGVNVASGNNTYTGTLRDGSGGGTLGLTKTGGGTLTLAGTNSYTGNTVITGGTLALTGSAGLASASIAVNSTLDVTGRTGASLTLASGQTLLGTGTVNGGIVAGSGATLSPAGPGTIGTLTTTALTLNTGVTLKYDFPASGTTSDLIAAGALTIGTGITLDLSNFNPTQSQLNTPFNLLSYTSLAGAGTTGGGLNGSGVFNVTGGPGTLTYTFGSNGTNVTLTISGTLATNATWANTGGGSWTAAGNWNPAVVPNNPGDTANFTNAITGSSTVTLDGNKTVGVLVFNNSTNSYTIAPGTGGSLIFNNAASSASLTATGSHAITAPIVLSSTGNNALTATVTNPSDVLTVGGGVSETNGAHALVKSGAGTLALTASSGYTGGTTLNAGTIQVGNNNALGSGGLNIAAAGTLQAGAAGLNLGNAITLGSGVTGVVDTQGFTMTLSGAIGESAASGALTKNGAGTLVLNGADTYTGATTVNNGTLQIGDGVTGSFSPTGAISVAATGTLAVNLPSGTLGNAITDNGAIIAQSAGANTLSGIISGSGTFTQSGAGTTTLSGANTFTGGTVISGGSLVLGNALALQNSTLNYNNQGGALSFGTLTAATLGGLSGAQSLALTNVAATPAGVTLSVGGNNATTVYTGTLSGLGSLTKNGTGSLTIGSGATGGATYSGTTTLTNGTLVLGGVTNVNAGANAINMTGVGTSNLTFADSAIYTTTGVMSQSAGVSTNISATTTLVKNNANVTVGSFRIGNGASIFPSGNGTSFTIQDAATFTATTTFDIQDINGGTTTAVNNQVNLNGGTLSVGSIIASSTSATHQSTIHFNGGVLRANADNATFLPVFTGSTNSVDSGGAKIDDGGHAITIAANLAHGTGTPDGGLTKQGTGTLTMTGTSAYTGGTTVNAGTVAVNNDPGAAPATTGMLSGTTTITVNAGGTLALTGANTVTNRINDNAAVVLNGAGGAAVSLQTNGLSERTLNGAVVNPGMGPLTLQSNSIIDLAAGASVVAFANSSAQTWVGRLSVINWSGDAVNGNGVDQLYFGTDTTGLSAQQLTQIQFFSDNGTTPLGNAAAILSTGEVVPVPEPTTTALVAMLGLGALGWSLRRRLAGLGASLRQQ